MGLFDIFKRRTKIDEHTASVRKNEPEGPTFLEAYTVRVNDHKKMQDFEWRRKLQMPSGQNKFRIRYYGKSRAGNSDLLTGTDLLPILIFAVDAVGTEILLFDGCKHGYNAMFCETYTKEQINEREANQYYKDENGSEDFEIVLSAFYQWNEEEFAEFIDENGNVELVDGSIVTREVAWRNSFDTFRIWAIRKTGEAIEIVSEELA